MFRFRTLTDPLQQLFWGNLLLFCCFLCYLIWWTLVFRPGSVPPSGSAVWIVSAFVSGTTAILITSAGLNSLSTSSHGIPLRLIILGSAVLYFLTMFFTTFVLSRPLTSELMIIHLWIAIEFSTIAILSGIGVFGNSRALLISLLVFMAYFVSIVCYVLFYKLSGPLGYYAGMLPLAIAVLISLVFSASIKIS